jgi:hypothetical protein
MIPPTTVGRAPEMMSTPVPTVAKDAPLTTRTVVPHSATSRKPGSIWTL